MMYICCKSCGFTLCISPGAEDEAQMLLGESQEEWYPDRYPCWGCGHTATIFSVLPQGAQDVCNVSPLEAFAYFNGLGLPSERDCNVATITELLTSKKIIHVVARSVGGTRRCVLDHVELEDGTKVYFGSSSLGATIYRVAPPFSYAKAVGDE
jgi:hypothetical protein